ncbi:helix-turn-helix domain-containing protein [Streptomyces sp. P38-E01]|uniref:Helix-turn-helix domain-containing protein n=1 Tax=Streptomyces tardus TaxID=2780544 RepID=A0A949JKQ8_9ACTN|nr:helix-turn-helix domain-containing protein [Streptomyces tardus]
MAPRSRPTARQQRLGAELRSLRETAGVSSATAAKALGVDATRISNIEAGRVGVNDERFRALAELYDCADHAFLEALVELGRTRRGRWWDVHRGTVSRGQIDLVEIETDATELRTAQTTHIPGVFQTAEYARAIFRQAVPELPSHEVEERVSFRLKRQEILFRPRPVPFLAVVHEAALRMQFGGAAAAKRQLNHLLEAGDRASVTLLIIPFAAGEFPGAGQTITYAAGPVPQLDTVILDASHGPEILYSETELAKYRALLGRTVEIALGAEESREFLVGIIEDL